MTTVRQAPLAFAVRRRPPAHTLGGQAHFAVVRLTASTHEHSLGCTSLRTLIPKPTSTPPRHSHSGVRRSAHASNPSWLVQVALQDLGFESTATVVPRHHPRGLPAKWTYSLPSQYRRRFLCAGYHCGAVHVAHPVRAFDPTGHIRGTSKAGMFTSSLCA